MKLSKVVFVVIAVLVFSDGESSKDCYSSEAFLSYIDLDRYNTSNPYIEFKSVVIAMLDYITQGAPVTNFIHEFIIAWIDVCRAENPKEEMAAWKDLATEIHHRLHSDESVFRIVKRIFGDRFVPWIMNPPLSLVVPDSRVDDCVRRLSGIFMEHCGVWNHFGLKYFASFYAMCSVGVEDDEFTVAAEETCRGYEYTLNPKIY